MCGIAGVLRGERATSPDELRAVADAMAAAVAHRGPDGSGVWASPEGEAAFGHRRLAVYDLTDAGAQPMTSSDGRWTVVFNGAVYNHVALRGELASRGHRFGGRSDTEVLVEALAEWGFAETLPRLNGMFALAAWDARERALFLARDRFGEKPLYCAQADGAFLFGSGLRCIEAVPWFRRTVDRQSLAAYLRLGYVPAPASIYQGVHKLLPGTWAVVRQGQMRTAAYWSAADVARNAVERRAGMDLAAAVEEGEALLRDAVSLRREADVPVGAFLSGGVDSSVVTALMPAPVHTFTARFDDPALDESDFARLVARHLGTQHTELPITSDDCVRLVPRLPELYDEPLADVSQVPTHLIAAEARRHVTAAVTGDGGDELFGGYNRHRWVPRIAAIPKPARHAASRLVGRLPHSVVHALPVPDPRSKLAKLGAALEADDVAGMYRVLTSQWERPPLDDADSVDTGSVDSAAWPAGATTAERLMLRDTVEYLPNDVLAKVDRATMGVALEARAPLLDHRVFEFAWRLPPALRQRRKLLRAVLDRHVPSELVNRPKLGFDPPAGEWLRTSLRPWAEDLLTADALARTGLAAEPVRAAWDEHVSGAADRTYQLWNVLMLQAWAGR